MIIVSPEKEKHVWHKLTLLDGRVLCDHEIAEEEKRRGCDIKLIRTGHITYRAPIMSPRGTTLWKEVE